MTTWPARKSSSGIRCGRMVNGRFVCQGLIGYVQRDAEGLALGTALPAGMTEDPPGSGFWRPTTRAARQANEGRWPGSRRKVLTGQMPAPLEMLPLPWRRPCPHCGAIALVTETVLTS